MQRSTTPNHGQAFAGLCLGGLCDGEYRVSEYPVMRVTSSAVLSALGWALQDVERITFQATHYFFHDFPWKHGSRERVWGFWVSEDLMERAGANSFELLDRLIAGYRAVGRG